MSRTYVLSAEADDDLLEIWSYVFAQSGSDRRADRVIDELYVTFDVIARNPAMGKPRDWSRGQSVFPHGAYWILYRIHDGDIEISRITGADEGVRGET